MRPNVLLKYGRGEEIGVDAVLMISVEILYFVKTLILR